MPKAATIMVVEDETGTRVTLCGILEDAGYKVIELETGAEAMEMIGGNTVDIVIADVRLPDVGGLEILESVREMNPDVAVIMMTGYAGVETAVDAVSQGAYAFFVKPIDPDEIKTTIANAVRQQRLLLENRRLVDSLQRSNQRLLKANEGLKKATQAKSEFLAKMSHELRTPLNVIIGFSQLIMDEVPGKINEEQKQCLDDVLTSSEHLLGLIDDVLDLSKIEAGKMELRLTDTSLADVIEELSSTMAPILAQKKQSLDVEVEGNLPPVRGDKAKVRQVLLNLLSNANKFTPEGGRLKIEVVRNSAWCQVSVIDTGIGLKREDQEQIFEPFYQVDGSGGSEEKGTGLGLPLTKEIIEQHRGRIWVESKYGKGSRFTFTLPLATTG